MTEKLMSVHEVATLTGITARTLHYYDEIGLLKPAKVTEAGYRMYDDAALGRLQNILLFRELEFPLKEIKAILDSPDFDPSEAIAQQIRLLELQYKHLGELIAFTREIQKKGAAAMNFDVFDKSEIEKYEEEVKAKWGNTKAYQEYRQKDITRDKEGYGKLADEMMTMFSELGKLKHLSPDAHEVQEKISALQQFITDHYYVCTDEILRGLGEMYVCDERFKNNIDKAGGTGTADFVRQAIVSKASVLKHP
jgi:DNA-binding transcriptional MerR regulator